MIQAPPRFAALDARMIRRGSRRPLPFAPAVRALVTRPGFREDARLFLFTYVAGLTLFLTWLA